MLPVVGKFSFRENLTIGPKCCFEKVTRQKIVLNSWPVILTVFMFNFRSDIKGLKKLHLGVCV